MKGRKVDLEGMKAEEGKGKIHPKDDFLLLLLLLLLTLRLLSGVLHFSFNPLSLSLFLNCSIFCRVMEFVRKNCVRLFPSLSRPSANVLSPGTGNRGLEDCVIAGPPAEMDQSWSAGRCILSLLKAIISALDVK